MFFVCYSVQSVKTLLGDFPSFETTSTRKRTDAANKGAPWNRYCTIITETIQFCSGVSQMRQLFVLSTCISLLMESGCSRSPRYYVDRGNALFDAGNYDEASIQYRNAIQKDQHLGDAYYRLGLSEIRSANLTEAYQAFGRAVDLMPHNDDAKVKLADVCFKAYLLDRKSVALYDKVVTLSDQLLHKSPNSFDGLRLKGQVALSDRKPKEAIAFLDKANGIRPMDREVALSLTQALIADDQFSAGEKLGLELIRKDKAFGSIYDVLYMRYFEANRLADAEAILKAKVDNNPHEASYFIELAGHYARAGKSQEMISTLSRLLGDPRRFPGPHLMVGDFYGRRGKWDEAIREFQAGAQAFPKGKIDFQKRIVNALRAQGKTTEALNAVESILTAAPKDEEGRIVRATLWLETRKPENIDAALPELETLVQARPDDVVLRFNLGRAHWLKNHPDAARTQFQEAIRRRGDYLPPHFALAVLYLNQRKSHDALVIAKKLVSYDASNIESRLLYAAALTEAGSLEEARVQLAQILKQSPTSRDAQLQLGVVALGQHKLREAERIFGRLHEAQAQDLRPASGLVNVYVAESQFDKAIQMLYDDLKKAPDSIAIRGLLAGTAARAGRYDLAIKEYLEMLSRTNAADPRIRLAQVYGQKGEIANATAMLERAVQLEPKNAAAVAGLAAVLAKSGRLAESKKRFRQLLELQPDNPRVLNDMAFVLSETGDDLDEALRLVRLALARTPDSSSAKDTLGWIYLKKKQTDSALQIFNTLSRNEPGKPTFRYHLGAALLEKGDKQRARIELQAALDNKPSGDDESRIRQLLRRTE